MNFSEHFERIEAGIKNTYGVLDLAKWISAKTKLNDKAYSFEHYEFQLSILADAARTTITVKPAQVGVSELSYRYAVALCCTQENFTTIYTFPTATDASNNNRTRIDPMIEASPEVKLLVNPNMNNSEMKQFGKNSFLMFKGTQSDTAGLSTPANAVIHDEYDKSDIANASVYVSRLQNRPHKLRKIFSTPTIEKYGVSKEAETAKRYRHIAKCQHCNHFFLPDYYNDIKVPDWNLPLNEITKRNLHTTKWREAYVACPKCGQDPQLRSDLLEFVCENPTENHDANAYFVSPFSVPSIILPSYLVNRSTQFERLSEFKNQCLGLTGEEANEALQLKDITDAEVQGEFGTGDLHVMGSDLGITCHITVGRMTTEGVMVIVHRERCNYTVFEARTRELSAKFRVIMHVMDSQPYTDMVTRLTKSRPNTYGAIFTTSKSTLPFTVQEEEADAQEGRMNLKLAKINRTVALDSLLGVIKQKELVIASSDENETYREQMLSLKRVQKFTSDGELTYTWTKTGTEEDHYHFATLYLWVAMQMRGMAGGVGAVSAGIPLVSVRAAPKYGTHGRQ